MLDHIRIDFKVLLCCPFLSACHIQVHLPEHKSLYSVYTVVHQSASQHLGTCQPKGLYYPGLFILFCPLVRHCVVSL